MPAIDDWTILDRVDNAPDPSSLERFAGVTHVVCVNAYWYTAEGNKWNGRMYYKDDPEMFNVGDQIYDWYAIKAPTPENRVDAIQTYFCTDCDEPLRDCIAAHAAGLVPPPPDPRQPSITRYIV